MMGMESCREKALRTRLLVATKQPRIEGRIKGLIDAPRAAHAGTTRLRSRAQGGGHSRACQTRSFRRLFRYGPLMRRSFSLTLYAAALALVLGVVAHAGPLAGNAPKPVTASLGGPAVAPSPTPVFKPTYKPKKPEPPRITKVFPESLTPLCRSRTGNRSRGSFGRLDWTPSTH